MNKKNDYVRQLRSGTEIILSDARQADEVRTVQYVDELLRDLRLHQLELEMQNEELRRAQTALEASCDRYLQLYDFAPIGYLTLTENGLITEANQACAALLGVERGQLVNNRFDRYITPEYQECWQRHFLHIKQQRGKQSYELSLRRADDTFFHAHLDCLHVETDDAPPVLRITLTDITERKQAEEAQRIAAAAFETQEGIIVTDARQTILRVNKAFSRITGYSDEETIGHTPVFLRSGVHSDDFYQALWATTTNEGYWQGEIWDRRKSGEIFPLLLTITVVADANGRITHYVGSFTDITAQKQAEKVLLKARKRLENQAATTKAELKKLKQESAEINAALNVLLKHCESEKSDAQSALTREMEGTVLPFLKKLKKASTDKKQSRLIDILESNLQHLVQFYGRSADLPSSHRHLLSPVELQVASMVRQGLSTKLIAATLNLSPGTVSIHRKHIRKKLGLDNKATNLHNYLMSSAEST